MLGSSTANCVSVFPRILTPFVPLLESLCTPFLDGVSAFPRVLTPFVPLLDSLSTLSLMVCPPSQRSWLLCTPSWLPLYPFLDGVSAFPRVLTSLVPLLDSLCTPFLDGVSASLKVLTSPISFLGWCVRVLQRCACLLEGLDTHCTPSWLPLYPFLTAFVPLLDSLLGWWVCLLEGIDSHCTPSWLPSYPFLDGVLAFARVLTSFVALLDSLCTPS